MKTLYLMRHGETLFNVHHKNQGWCDSPLTERGHAQARIAGRHLRELGIRPDHLFSSTSERASDTLEDVCLEAYGEIPPYERLRGLKEWNFGAYEGEDSFLNPAPPFGDFFVPYGGDSQETLVARMRKTTEEIMSRPDVSCALAVSHEQPARTSSAPGRTRTSSSTVLASRTARSSRMPTTRIPIPSAASTSSSRTSPSSARQTS